MRGVSKYKNVTVEIDGHKFDSAKESRRYGALKLMERANMISDLKLQEKFQFVINGVKVCSYVADFTYLDKGGQLVVEDVKSEVTRGLPVYRIKNKLMVACHSIVIKEV